MSAPPAALVTASPNSGIVSIMNPTAHSQQQKAQLAVTQAKSGGIVAKLVSGSIAGIIGTTIIYPIDMVKTRLQNQTGNQYKGVIDCFRQTVRAEGSRGLYRGISANLVGITPEKAIKLAVNDLAREHFASRLQTHPDSLPIVWGMLSGALAGTCQVIATCPMEVTKIQMQLAALNTPKGQQPPSLAQVVRGLGVRGMYKGTAATLMRDVPFSILFFPAHAFFKGMCADEEGKVSFGHVFGSGILAGWLAAGAVTPMDVIKTRLQASGSPYTGIRHCFTDIVRNEGPKALFKGTLPRCMIVSPLFGITLLVYEVQQRLLKQYST
ncbi:mitochondrial carrier domain-containing protein [Catenaria anguillulae PL171]|uniref:Mitochondrial carrier domain-containing protein n=1 Tax=Catenaria anguillulae PL171 TaxID=765915 RepID=A0A1Y2HNA2_9FUNG|nr:mitochondrial carrier domain-containing protein [Catenaria anguillulae PL171]